MYKILINDGLCDEGQKLFSDSGFLVDVKNLKPEELVERVSEYNAVIIRSATKMTGEIIKARCGIEGKLSYIGRAGVGVDNIDIGTASEYGVVVKNAPGGNTDSTAQLTMGLMLGLSRRIPELHHQMREGKWLKKIKESVRGIELGGKTLGIYGCGRIGQRVSEYANAFGMELLGYDVNQEYVKRNWPNSRINLVDEETLLKNSDVVTVHTGGGGIVIGEPQLRQMKQTALFVNASRGGNIDEDALYEALLNRRIAGAALDVYVDEKKIKVGSNGDAEFPLSIERFRTLDNIVLTPHVGAETNEAQTKTGIEMARVTIDYFLNLDSKNSVNLRGESRFEVNEKQTHPLRIVHDDSKGMYGTIGTVIGRYTNMTIHAQKIGEPKLKRELTVCLLEEPANDILKTTLRKIKGVHRVWE